MRCRASSRGAPLADHSRPRDPAKTPGDSDLDEILVKSRAGRSRLRVEILLGRIVLVRVEDDGPSFDPTAVRAPCAPQSLDEASPGGLGLVLVRRLAAAFRWRREGDRNVTEVTLTRSTGARP